MQPRNRQQTILGRSRFVTPLGAFLVLGMPLGAACGNSPNNGEPSDGGGIPDGSAFDSAAMSSDGGSCAPRTCETQGISCGPAGDGCGGLLQCGMCTPPQSCGGGGTSSVCGASSDGGSACTPKTCATLGYDCGPAGDGCGNELDCGTCTAPKTCGGGGQASVCGGGGGAPDSGGSGGQDSAVVGPTYTAASCNQSDVNAVINGPTHTAVNGDRIVIPAGTCTWTSGITVPSAVGLTLTGAGTPSSGASTTGASSSCTSTKIIDNVGSSNALIGLTPNYGTATTRVSCMAIDPASTSTALTAPIQMTGSCMSSGCPAFRIDNITFGVSTQWTEAGNSSQAAAVIRVDDVFGVMDHNTIPSGSEIELFNAQMYSYLGVGSYGDNSWAQPNSLGGANNVFAENNLFYSAAYFPLNDCEAGNIGGCRVVDRYNTMYVSGSGAFGIFANHGTETSGRGRSGREAEVYDNTYHCEVSCASADGGLRGGTGMFFNNSIVFGSGAWATDALALNTYRTVFAANTWGACGGSGSWDKNDGTVYFSGTVGAVSNGNLTMTDGSKSFGNLVPTGDPYSIYDVTQGWWGEIGSNTGTSITVNGTISEQSPYGFNAGDSYQVLRAEYCIDQTGRGQGSYLSGTTPTPTGYPDQALEPVYQWGDTASGGNVNFPMGSDTGKVINYRDYYAQASGIQTSPSSPFSCNGSTGGAGWGTLANRPSSCSGACVASSPGCGYWASDANGGTGQLYVWKSGAWTTYYTPYTYPHPLAQ
jgi:hypothetical protein